MSPLKSGAVQNPVVEYFRTKDERWWKPALAEAASFISAMCADEFSAQRHYLDEPSDQTRFEAEMLLQIILVRIVEAERVAFVEQFMSGNVSYATALNEELQPFRNALGDNEQSNRVVAVYDRLQKYLPEVVTAHRKAVLLGEINSLFGDYPEIAESLYCYEGVYEIQLVYSGLSDFDEQKIDVYNRACKIIRHRVELVQGGWESIELWYAGLRNPLQSEVMRKLATLISPANRLPLLGRLSDASTVEELCAKISAVEEFEGILQQEGLLLHRAAAA